MGICICIYIHRYTHYLYDHPAGDKEVAGMGWGGQKCCIPDALQSGGHLKMTLDWIEAYNSL